MRCRVTTIMKKGNIKENMLSLKSMKAELDLLKRQIPDPRISSITENFDSNGNVKSITSRLRAGAMFPFLLINNYFNLYS